MAEYELKPCPFCGGMALVNDDPYAVEDAWYSSSSVKRNTRSHLVHLLSSSQMRMLQHL